MFRQAVRVRISAALRHRSTAAAFSPWQYTEKTPPDPILGLVAAFKVDTFPSKVNLSQGAYRTDEGKPFVLSSVLEAERRVNAAMLSGDIDKEYLPIEGDSAFRRLSAALVFGNESAALAEARCATLQTISGTGALSVMARALQQIAGVTTIHVPSPSWGNHQHIFRKSGLNVESYAYLDPNTGTTLDFGAMHSALSALPPGSAVLLHACAHNPTGIDPTASQWSELADLFFSRDLLAVFDSAYQGYASGDLAADAASIRVFELAGVLPIVCQSYAKSMGLYGERIGAVNFVCSSADEATAVMSQVKQNVIRPMYSSPPLHGARLAATVLGDNSLFEQWCDELRVMATRVVRMRTLLTEALRAEGAPSPDGGDWQHVVDQIGMFAYTGLSAENVDRLKNEHHIYLTRDGRMAMAAMKPGDIEYVAKAIRAVMT